MSNTSQKEPNFRSIDELLNSDSEQGIKVKGTPSGIVTVSGRYGYSFLGLLLDRKLYGEMYNPDISNYLRTAALAKDAQEHGHEVVVVGDYHANEKKLYIKHLEVVP